MPTKTGWFLIVITLVLLIWELYVIITGESMTISEQIWNINERTLIVAYAAGLLSGHFFWYKKQ